MIPQSSDSITNPWPRGAEPVRIMFVCLGNICRSPAAQAVMQALVEKLDCAHKYAIDSAGTASYHIGKRPDSRMMVAGTKRGLRFDSVAQSFQRKHASERHWILAMDRENKRDILAIAKLESAPHICLLSDVLDQSWPCDVPDPYYGGEAGFEYVLDMLQAACPKLLHHIQSKDTQ